MRRHSSRRLSARANDGEDLLFGANAVLEQLRATPGAIATVWVVPETRAAQEVIDGARAGGVAVEVTDRATLDRLTGGRPHQGVAARTRAFAYTPFERVLETRAPLLVALDGVTDPQNLGAIVRSAEVLGAGAVILPRDRSAQVTAAVARASAGASAHLAIAQVVNLARALEEAKAGGYWIVALSPAGTSEFRDLPVLERVVLVVGSEGKGARPLVLRAADFQIRIPMAGKVESLNVSVAAGIGLYALREHQRGRLQP